MKIYYLSKEKITRKEIEKVRYLMPNRYKKANSKDTINYLSIASSVLLLKVFPSIDESQIETNGYGKPCIKKEKCFSLSHCGDLAMLALDNNDVGIDIEKIDKERIKTTNGLFTEKELKWISNDPITNFFILWTFKESLLKAIGTGIVSRLDKIDVLGFINDGFIIYQDKKWYGKNASFNDYVVSVVSLNKIDNIEFIEIA